MFPNFLRISLLTEFGIFQTKITENNTIQVTGGMEADFLKMLSDKLKFRYSVIVPKDLEWGRKKPDGDWTGIIGLLARKEADIGIGTVGIVPERLTAVDFSFPYYRHEITFGTKPPGFSSREIAIFLPFRVNLWAAILAAIVFETIVFKLLLKRKYAFQEVFLFVLGCFLNGTKRIRYGSTGETILHGSWLISSVIISLSYTSLLLSFLTIPQRERPISNRYELVEALRSGTYKSVVQKGSTTFGVLASSKDEKDLLITKYIEDNDWFIPPGIASLKNSVEEERVAVISAGTTFLYFEDVHVAEDCFAASYIAIALRKDFCCKRQLDDLIHRITSACLYEKKIKDFIFKLRLKYMTNQKEETDPIRPLKLQELAGAFFILISGYVLGIIALVSEFYAARRQR